MPTKRVLSPESVWDTAAVLQACAASGVKPLHANRLWSHLIRHPEASFADVPDLPKAFLSVLQEKFTRSSSTVQEAKRSDDGDTVKLLVTLQDGMQVRCMQGRRGWCWRAAAATYMAQLHSQASTGTSPLDSSPLSSFIPLVPCTPLHIPAPIPVLR